MPILHIGILAHSADGSALCFLEMVREASRRLGAHQHPEITLSILPMGPSLAGCEVETLAEAPVTDADNGIVRAPMWAAIGERTAATSLPALSGRSELLREVNRL